MAVTINMDSCVAKFNDFIKSAAGREKISSHLDDVVSGSKARPGGLHTPTEAADKFIEVLGKTIDSNGLPENVKDAIKELKCTRPEKLSDGTYRIVVFFDTELDRPSLYRGTLHDLAELYNDGYEFDPSRKRVWGYWHGEFVGSKTMIPGTHFMEEAVAEFNTSYSNEYNTIVEIRK